MNYEEGFHYEKGIKKLIAAALTFLLGLSATIFNYADELSNQGVAGNIDNNWRYMKSSF